MTKNRQNEADLGILAEKDRGFVVRRKKQVQIKPVFKLKQKLHIYLYEYKEVWITY